MMKQEKCEYIRSLLHDSQLEEAELFLTSTMLKDNQDSDVYYWLGNLHRQRHNWKLALEYYAHAIELNPHSKAVEARQMLLDIIQFRDMQRYNV